MNLAKISPNGQITVPMEIRRLLNLQVGDKFLFLQK
jgi:AbrB family looped-hinge helix DNA binding protein